MKRTLSWGGLLLLFLSAPGLFWRAAGNELDVWHVRGTFSGSKIAFGNGRFVAFNAYPAFFYVSTNGGDWNVFVSPEPFLLSLKFLNGQFVALLSNTPIGGSGYISTLYTSADGTEWVRRTASSLGFQNMACGNGIYLGYNARTSGGTLNCYTSTNLSDWVLTLDGTASFSEVAFGNGLFATFYLNGYPPSTVTPCTSSDGLVWELRPSTVSTYYPYLRFINGRFIAFVPQSPVYNNWFARSAASYNGSSWDEVTLVDYPAFTIFSTANFASANNLAFIFPSFSAPASVRSNFLASSDGLNWDEHSFGVTNLMADVTFGLNTYLAVGSGVILQSDPVTNPPPTPARLNIQDFPAIGLSGEVGQHYQLQCADGLGGTNMFRALTNIFLTASPFIWVDITASNSPQRFYRTVLLNY